MEKMVQSMMKRFPMIIGIGFMLVVLSVIIGAVNASNAAEYYAFEKASRETNLELAETLAGIESTGIWLPYFKFLGLSMILAGITMALGVIATRLQKLGMEVMSIVPPGARMNIPPRPRSAMWMRIWMILGMMVILIGFVVSLSIAGTAFTVYSNPVVAIDSASSGSALLNGLSAVHSAEGWLEGFKFVGVAFLFMGIVNGLATILVALKFQKQALPQVVDKLPAVPSATAGD